jgi:hypothetical protein
MLVESRVQIDVRVACAEIAVRAPPASNFGLQWIRAGGER